MDFLTAYVTLATSFLENSVKLGWPVALAWVAWLFRDVIKTKLTSLQDVDGYGVKLNFREEMVALVEEARYVAQPSAPSGTPAEPPFELTSPESVFQKDLFSTSNGTQLQLVSNDFAKLSSELRRVAGPYGYTRSGQKRFVESVLRSLVAKKVIGLDLAKQISKLRDLRNIAVDNPENISEEEYSKYSELVAGAIAELKKLDSITEL